MKFLDLNGVSILWQRVKETFAMKSETVSDISRNDTTFTVTRADGTTFEFTQKDTTYDNATTTSAGLMSAEDKTKLNGVESGAQENIVESVAVNGTVQPINNKGINIAVPTAISDLNNDIGYLVEESDPTVPAWAKQPQKPAYTASEVGALPADTVIPTKVSQLTNDSGYLMQHQDISGKANIADLATVATSGSYNDLTNKPTIPTVPTDVSAFTNDAGYVDDDYVAAAITDALADITGIEYHVCTASEYDAQTYIPTLEGESGVIYLVPKPASAIGSATVGTSAVSGNNIYYEFIYNGQSFEMIGDTQVSLDGYLEDSDISTDAQVQSVITEVFGGA